MPHEDGGLHYDARGSTFPSHRFYHSHKANVVVQYDRGLRLSQRCGVIDILVTSQKDKKRSYEDAQRVCS